ncbi:MAG TPA: hypothetical protein VK203_27630 [Nostocaceae cyanobacterium]|nr:hypothetical protein [Nostocaceae cyanobacterium]
MLNNHCDHNCNIDNCSHCPFVQDSRNLNRYVCLKCGIERQINNRTFSTGTLVLILVSLVIMLPMVDKYDQPKQQPEEELPVIGSLQ